VTTTASAFASARRLGAGGEAEVFEVPGRPRLAAKVYRSPTAERARKLRVMLAHPPEGTDAGGHVAIAWPVELMVAADGSVEGFLMPRIDLAATVSVFQVYNPASRVAIAPAFTWQYLLRTARNVAAIVDSLHRAGYVVGDINESNLLVNRRALAVLVDCDSMQVRDPATGDILRGGVAKPEFTAPELLGRDLAATDRTQDTDNFALAVLVFLLLLEGAHPFAGIWRGRGDPPDIATRIAGGHFAYRRGAKVAPPPHALPIDVLPPELRKMVWRTFTSGMRRPTERPSAGEWAAALERAGENLRTCDRSPHHQFGAHRRKCPWCARIDTGFPDPFPGPEGRSELSARRAPFRRRLAIAAAATARSATAWTSRQVQRVAVGPLPLATVAAGAATVVPAAAIGVWLAWRAAWPAVRVRRRGWWHTAAIDAATASATTGVALALLVAVTSSSSVVPWGVAVRMAAGVLAVQVVLAARG